MATLQSWPAPMSPAWVLGSPDVEDLALPKSLKVPHKTKREVRLDDNETRISGALQLYPRQGCHPVDVGLEVPPVMPMGFPNSPKNESWDTGDTTPA